MTTLVHLENDLEGWLRYPFWKVNCPILLCLAQRHSRFAVGLSISVSLKDACRIKSHSSKTTCIALEFIVGLRYSLLYFLVEVSLPRLVQDKKDTTIVHIAKSGILVLSYQTWIVFLPCRLCPSKQWTKTTIIWFLFISIYIYTNSLFNTGVFLLYFALLRTIYRRKLRVGWNWCELSAN